MVTVADPLAPIAGFDPAANSGDGYYDAEAAQRAVDFFHHRLTHVKTSRFQDAGNPFVLSPWEEQATRLLYGCKDENGFKRFRQCYVSVSRKNGKTTWLAGLGLLELFASGIQGGELYAAATDREQASILYRISSEMVRRQPSFMKYTRIVESTKRLIYQKGKKTPSVLRAIPANEASAHGFDSSFIMGDELHCWPGRAMYDVLETSKGARAEACSIYITTAGWDRSSICYEVHQRAEKIRDGRSDDATFLPLIFSVPQEADWHDKGLWHLANPNIGVSVSEEYLDQQYKVACDNPRYQNTFRRLHLNQWTSQSKRWLDMSHWDACK